MNLFKGKRLGRYLKPKEETGLVVQSRQPRDEPQKPGNGFASPNKDVGDSTANAESEGEEEEDDFITHEVKRRLRELKRNSCMVLIPEEDGEEEEEGDEEGEPGSGSGQCDGSELGSVFPRCGFSGFYGEYCERMHFFEMVIAQHFQNAAVPARHRRPERAASRRLASGYRLLSLKRKDDQLPEESQRLHQHQDEAEESFQKLETAYVAHLALAWEALHWQYAQLRQKTMSAREGEESGVVTHWSAAQAFQQFQVLLQRFVENEPFEPGSRVEVYARARLAMPVLLHVPSFQGWELEAEDSDSPVRAADVLKAMEESARVFRLFLEAERTTKAVGLRGSAARLRQRVKKLKGLLKKSKAWKRQKKASSSREGVELVFALIDLGVVSRVLRTARTSKEQLTWCEEKMSKLRFSQGELQRDSAPLLFPS